MMLATMIRAKTVFKFKYFLTSFLSVVELTLAMLLSSVRFLYFPRNLQSQSNDQDYDQCSRLCTLHPVTESVQLPKAHHVFEDL